MFSWKSLLLSGLSLSVVSAPDPGSAITSAPTLAPTISSSSQPGGEEEDCRGRNLAALASEGKKYYSPTWVGDGGCDEWADEDHEDHTHQWADLNCEKFNYDGGDCCAKTCKDAKLKCGDNCEFCAGFNCKDPNNMPALEDMTTSSSSCTMGHGDGCDESDSDSYSYSYYYDGYYDSDGAKGKGSASSYYYDSDGAKGSASSYYYDSDGAKGSSDSSSDGGKGAKRTLKATGSEAERRLAQADAWDHVE